MAFAKPDLLKILKRDALQMDLVTLHQRRIFRSFAFCLGIVYGLRFFYRWIYDAPGLLITLIMGPLAFILYCHASKPKDVFGLSLVLVVAVYAAEMALVLIGANHFTSFLLILPLSIVFLAVMTNLRMATLLSGIATALSIAFISQMPTSSWLKSLPLDPSIVPRQFLLFLIGAQLLIMFIIYLFEDMLKSSERENQSRHLNEARVAQKSAVAETLGKAAHEFNNPLAILDAALLRLHFYHRQGDLLQQRRSLEAMADAVVRMDKLLQNVRVFVKGQLDEDIVSVSAKDIHKTFDELAQKRLMTSGVILHEGQVYHGRVLCRPKQVEFVLQVFLQNAIEATEKSPRIISFQSFPHQDFIRLAIDDNGVGVSSENAPMVFTPFFSTKIIGQTTGMNLSICQMMIREQNGHMGFEPIRAGGTRFYIDLPKAADERSHHDA